MTNSKLNEIAIKIICNYDTRIADQIEQEDLTAQEKLEIIKLIENIMLSEWEEK